MHDELIAQAQYSLNVHKLKLTERSHTTIDPAMTTNPSMLRLDAVPGGQAAEDAMVRDMLKWEAYCANNPHIPLLPDENSDEKLGLFADIDALIGCDSPLVLNLEPPRASISRKPGADTYIFLGSWKDEEEDFLAFIAEAENDDFMTIEEVEDLLQSI
jgi:hypothetical protein